MARGKLQRQLIENRSARNSTYRKRIRGLKKKTYELATLCDVPTFLVSFGPDGQVDTWPESTQEIKDILRRYNSTCGNKASSKNKLDAEGLLRMEIRRKRKQIDRTAMDSADKLQEMIKSVDSKLGEVDQRMQLLGNQHFARMLEEQEPTSLQSFEGDYNQDIRFDGTVQDYPDIRFCKQMADGEVLEEENFTSSFGLKDCLDDNRHGENKDGVGFQFDFPPPTETMGLSTTLPQTEQANCLDQSAGFDSSYRHMCFSSSPIASHFGAAFGGVDSQIAVDNRVWCPYKATNDYGQEQAPITGEIYDDAPPLWSCSEFGLHNTSPVW